MSKALKELISILIKLPDADIKTITLFAKRFIGRVH